MTNPLETIAELAADMMLEKIGTTFEELHQPIKWHHIDGSVHTVFGFDTEEEFEHIAKTGKPNSYVIAMICLSKVKECSILSGIISKSFGFDRPSQLAEVMYNNLGKAELAALLADEINEFEKEKANDTSK